MNNGYTRIPNELMRNTNLSPIAKVAWSLIAGMSPRFNVTMSQYCKMAACHQNTWRNVVKLLEGFGMITVEHSANGVTYTAITDTSKWSVDGNKNCDPNKICKGNKNCEGKGNNICDAGGNKICDPSEEHKEKQDKNNTATTCVCARERLAAELLTDGRIELARMQHNITVEQYRQMVKEILADWQFRDLPDSDYNLNHFSSVLRYKVATINNRNNGTTNQFTGNPGDPRTKLDEDAIKAMAALASRSQQSKVVPF